MFKKIIIFLFTILMVMLIVMIYMLKNVTIENENSIEIIPQTIEDVIEKYNSKYLRESDENIIYADFSKNLFSDTKESNEKYFLDMIKELEQFYPEKSFRLVDEEKNIVIDIYYDDKENKYSIKINEIEGFYEKIDADSYIGVENCKICTPSNIAIKNELLYNLKVRSMQFNSISKLLDDGISLSNGYISYMNDLIRIRKSEFNTVRNIIYNIKNTSKKINISSKINSDMALEEIYNVEPTNAFGSVNEGYLGYRNADFYMFFYDDEISIYSYNYSFNTEFEDALVEYLKTKDLEKFVKIIQNSWPVYDVLEYDNINKCAYILCSNRGVEINIKNNDPKGITLFSNYYFTDQTKDLVKKGLISFDLNNDLVDLTEKNRRNNNLFKGE